MLVEVVLEILFNKQYKDICRVTISLGLLLCHNQETFKMDISLIFSLNEVEACCVRRDLFAILR